MCMFSILADTGAADFLYTDSDTGEVNDDILSEFVARANALGPGYYQLIENDSFCTITELYV